MPEVEGPDHDQSPALNQQDVDDDTASNTVWDPLPLNSHLHRSVRRVTVDPVEDLLLSEMEMKSRRRVSLVMSEMVQTERDYVRALQLIVDQYIPELQCGDVPPILQGKKAVIFGNLEKIHHFHSQYFIKHLEKCQNQPFLVGQFFLQHEKMFQLYPLYNKNKPKSDYLMMEFGKKFFRQKQMGLGDKMDLSSYLLKPVQRLGKYALLLKQLLKECAETELEYPDLKAAEAMVKFQLRHGNDLLAMDSLRGCDGNLQEHGILMRQDEFLVFHGHKKSVKRIFLFQDRILFSKTRRARQGMHDTYAYKTSFKTKDIGLTENSGECGCKFGIWFHRKSVRHNYVLQAPNSQIKKAWVEDISLILWRQAINNKESRLNNLATMGIGSKPCFDIQPNEDNIQDHTINVSLSRIEGQTRNVISAFPYDSRRNGHKRPHSIISISSTSSSGSSQSSFGSPASLNIGVALLSSPDMNRTSIFLNESDVITTSDASEGSLSFENRTRHHHRRIAAFSSFKSYFYVLKSRILKQKHSNSGYTDV